MASRHWDSTPSVTLAIPTLLLKPGTEILKISSKPSRRVKSKKIWLEFHSSTLDDPGGSAAASNGRSASTTDHDDVDDHDLRICWDKPWKPSSLLPSSSSSSSSTITASSPSSSSSSYPSSSSGPSSSNSPATASLPFSAIRDIRVGTSGSPYRTALQLSPSVEPRWLSIIYVGAPNKSGPSAIISSLASGLAGGLGLSGSTSSGAYKMLHFIFPTVDALKDWQRVLEAYKDAREKGARLRVLLAQPATGTTETTPSSSCEVNPSNSAEEKVESTVRVEDVHKLCARLGMGMKKEDVEKAFILAAHPLSTLNFTAFQNFVKLLKKRVDIEDVFRTASGGALEGMGRVDWERFLTCVQKMLLSPQAVDILFRKYADPASSTIQLEGFTQFLLSSDTNALRDESAQDMKRPISEYFISSSHNTYLVGNQIQGESTVEGYIRALQRGCRCVELDIWPDSSSSSNSTSSVPQPIVTHGRTLTSKLTAHDALTAIAKYAFIASPYPLILSLEIHCGVEVQERLVEILRDTLGDMLLSERIDGAEGEVDVLPSPWDLRGKILIKAKNNFLSAGSSTSSPHAGVGDPDSSTESSSTSSDSDFKRVFNAVRRSFDDRRRSSSYPPVTPPALPLSNPLSSSPTSTLLPPSRTLSPSTAVLPPSSTLNLASLTTAAPLPSPPLLRSPSSSRILPPSVAPLAPSSSGQHPPQASKISVQLEAITPYTKGHKFLGFNSKTFYPITSILSFSETKLEKICKEELVRLDLVSHCRTKLVRVYPKGWRVDSSNYLGHAAWSRGVQCAAINWQTFDLGMAINTAMFARAGRLGYVLKPELLRTKGAEKDKESLTRSAGYILSIEVISAQQLPRVRELDSAATGASSNGLDPFVEVSLHVPTSSAPIKKRTKVIQGNAFNPLFSSSFSIPFSSNPATGMLDLIFLRFEVLNAKGNLKAATEEGKGDFVGAYMTSLGALPEGYRHLPLYDALGDQHLFSSLFIRSSVTLAPATMLHPSNSVSTRHAIASSIGATISKGLSRTRSSSSSGGSPT